MTDAAHRDRIAETLAGPRRMEAMTLRCEHAARRRIETAFERERQTRPQLSLGRFLAECVANGLPENLPQAGPSGADADEIAILVAEQIGGRLAGIEAAIPVIADVLGDLAQKVAALDRMVGATQTDAARTRELIEQAVGGESASEGESGAGDSA